MRKNDCLRWAKALMNGKHEKLKGRMSNSRNFNETPTAMCCLGVANEEFKVEGYELDRVEGAAGILWKVGILGNHNPQIFGECASVINDGPPARTAGINKGGLTHEQIGILLLFAIESGEYKNI
jgi:hypothetical protein